MRKSVTLLSAAAAVAVAAGAYVYSLPDDGPLGFQTANVERGGLLKTVSASGVVTPVVTVQVGSQISGRIAEIAADFNTEVAEGDVIARIDPESFEAKVRAARAELAVARAAVTTKNAAAARARADLEGAEANVLAAEADIAKAKVAAEDARLDLDRKRELAERGAASVSTVDKARAVFETALAQIDSARAALDVRKSVLAANRAQIGMAAADILQAEAQVAQREAGLSIAETDLKNTIIRSPVDGVVIARSVDVGQTVAASLQAPTLFTIAQDLRRMQVEASIDEADIGQIEPGQRAKFTVDSFAGREFEGKVAQVRKAPLEVQSVVTYTVVITAANEDLRLLPGMTANVQVAVSERRSVLKVPDKALRFRMPGADVSSASAAPGQAGPPAASGPPGGIARARERLERLIERLDLSSEQAAQVREFARETWQRLRAMRQSANAGTGDAGNPNFAETARMLREQLNAKIAAVLTPDQKSRFQAMMARRAADPIRNGELWVLRGNQPVRVAVAIGLGDGQVSEIVRGDLAEGETVILDVTAGEKTSSRGIPFRFGF
jgi:HlyD family secretion protein